jgi:uncharacterized protein YaiE (UPF0345 family)
MTLSHRTFFDGKCQSIGFERHGRRQTMGALAPGEYTFPTDGPERMTVVCGELLVRIKGQDGFTAHPAGTAFEVAAKSSFELKVAQPSGYWCEFL